MPNVQQPVEEVHYERTPEDEEDPVVEEPHYERTPEDDEELP